MSDNTIRQVILLGALAIMGVIGVQSYWVMNTWDIQQEEFDRTVKIALMRTAQNLAEIDSVELPTRDLIKQTASNAYVVNYENPIKISNLEHYLSKELQDRGLILDFEYGIFDCSSDEMVYGDYCSVGEENTALKSSLPKYDDFIYYFSVRFPSMPSHLLNRMQLSVLFTVILLFAVLFSIYCMFIIVRQKRLSEMQKDFINNMTHEFKTPISTIKIAADYFHKNEDIQNNPRLSKYTNIIQEQNQRLNNQVEKVLQIAQMEKDNFKLNPEPIELNQFIEKTLKGIEMKIQERGGMLKTRLSNASMPIQADRLHLSNILSNLLDNSIKYSKEGIPEIEVSTTQIGERILLEIQDKGIGISKEHLGRIFDKFYRVPTGNVHDVKGFGLGLFYIKNIIEQHGWKIKVNSKKDIGTTVAITI